THFFLGISENKYVFLLLVNILLLLLGTFMDLAPMLLICTPIFMPVILKLGIDPVHFGIVMILNLGIGLITPPVGPTLFVGCAIGNTRDRQGRLLTCEHGGRRVSRTEPDGSIVTLVDRIDDKKLNSPNDIVCKSDGSVWFTDPTFGILGWYEGGKAEPELPMN